MTDFYSASSAVSPLTALLWCLYPIAVLVIIELLLGGGFDDDNDDQDGGMLIPAYSRSDVWNFLILNYNLWKNFSKIVQQYWYNSHFPNFTYHSYHFLTFLAGLENP